MRCVGGGCCFARRLRLNHGVVFRRAALSSSSLERGHRPKGRSGVGRRSGGSDRPRPHEHATGAGGVACCRPSETIYPEAACWLWKRPARARGRNRVLASFEGALAHAVTSNNRRNRAFVVIMRHRLQRKRESFGPAGARHYICRRRRRLILPLSLSSA